MPAVGDGLKAVYMQKKQARPQRPAQQPQPQPQPQPARQKELVPTEFQGFDLDCDGFDDDLDADAEEPSHGQSMARHRSPMTQHRQPSDESIAGFGSAASSAATAQLAACWSCWVVNANESCSHQGVAEGVSTRSAGCVRLTRYV